MNKKTRKDRVREKKGREEKTASYKSMNRITDKITPPTNSDRLLVILRIIRIHDWHRHERPFSAGNQIWERVIGTPVS